MQNHRNKVQWLCKSWKKENLWIFEYFACITNSTTNFTVIHKIFFYLQLWIFFIWIKTYFSNTNGISRSRWCAENSEYIILGIRGKQYLSRIFNDKKLLVKYSTLSIIQVMLISRNIYCNMVIRTNKTCGKGNKF